MSRVACEISTFVKNIFRFVLNSYITKKKKKKLKLSLTDKDVLRNINLVCLF